MAEGPIFWHQGLFLQPQHFQRTDMRTEELLASLAGLARPWLWGVRTLRFDEGALMAGTVSVTEARLLFPGMGVELTLPGNAVCAARPLPESINVGDSVDVWLGLRVLKSGEPNVSVCVDAAALAQASTRLGLVEGQPAVEDLYQKGPTATLRHLSYVLKLVFGPEKDDTRDMTLMRVARLKRMSDGLRLEAEYAPPCLCLEESARLMEIFRDVRDRVLGKTRELDSYKRLARRARMGELTTLFLILRSLARFAARLESMVAMPVAPPWEAHLVLRELLAELSVFSTQVNALGEDAQGQSTLLPYVHDDAAPAFAALRDAIARLLDGLSTGPRYMVRFEPNPPFYEARLSPHLFDKAEGSEYWVSLHSESTDLHSHTESLRRIKISADSEMPVLLARALPGLAFSIEEYPPMGLAGKTGAAYLRLHPESPLWAKVQEQGILALAWEEAPGDLVAHFVVLEG
ncbi:MAG: type VI secretion system baseplate subunit TssK [Desulfovibrionaceae bacterium]|nr:type VI secretion system baseplate subunit TssK [Desulfovibrionaceae bacterium]